MSYYVAMICVYPHLGFDCPRWLMVSQSGFVDRVKNEGYRGDTQTLQNPLGFRV